MARLILALVVSVLSVVPRVGYGDDMPREGTFAGYFFVDRWKQPRFDTFYVEPRFTEELSAKQWRPLRIISKSIHQAGNPGGAMIRQIEKVEVVEEVPLQIELEVSKSKVGYGEAAKLLVKMTNVSDKRVELYRRELLLTITVHERGRLPGGEPIRDFTYDSHTDPYTLDLASARLFLRATNSLDLLTDPGEISMAEGSPFLYIEKGGGRRRAGLEDEVKSVIPPQKSATFGYRIGSGWFVNEYELQVQYRPPATSTVPYILSKPIAFDVTR